jgi:hypothetical protein
MLTTPNGRPRRRRPEHRPGGTEHRPRHPARHRGHPAARTRRRGALAVVVITTFDTDAYVHGALKAGVCGFVLKGARPERLVEAVHAAVRGDALINPAVTARLLDAFATSGPAPAPTPRVPDRARRRCPSHRPARADKRRDQPGAPCQGQHGEVPPREPRDQTRRPQPSRAGGLGPRDQARGLVLEADSSRRVRPGGHPRASTRTRCLAASPPASTATLTAPGTSISSSSRPVTERTADGDAVGRAAAA